MQLYIHVPFCRKKCLYCTFYSVPLARGKEGVAQMSAYISSVVQELDVWGERLGKKNIRTIFFGGGTPSLLPEKALAAILDKVRKIFVISPIVEITAEANPDSALEDGWLFSARRVGINRLSLGVQSLLDSDLATLGRVHSAKAAIAAFETARAAGFANISLDFMWGLPGEGMPAQSQVQWLRQLRQATELGPEHISAYGLTIEPNTPLEKSCAAGTAVLPSEKEQASMYIAGAEYMESRGYMQYEVSNFARMGFASIHNRGYWEGASYLGVGPAATSTITDKRWTNPESIEEWQAAVKSKKLAMQVEVLDMSIRQKELVMLRLRTAKGLPLQEWNALAGTSFLKIFSDVASLLQKNGLATTRKGYFRLTRSGMLVSNTILSHFFDAIAQQREKTEGKNEKK